MTIINTRYGKFNIIDTDSLISVSLRLYGEWAQHEIDLLACFIQPSSVVVDAGAFIGTHARAFSELVGSSGKVLAFEPRQDTCAVLIENAKLSPGGNICVINSALGATEAFVTVPTLQFEMNSNFGAAQLTPMSSFENTGEKVKITPLDACKLDRLDFMKIDVEGMEIAVLNGAKETVGRCRPVIFAECNSLETGVPIITWCQKENYQAYGVLCHAYNKHNFASNTDNVFGASQETGVLLIPIERFAQHKEILFRQHLPKIETADDFVLLLLHKPQYPHEVLAHSATATNLSLMYGSPLADVLNQAVVERDGRIASLNQGIAERDAQIASLNQDVAERDGRIASLSHSISERDGRIASLSQGIAERDAQIASLNQDVAERDGRIASLSHSISERDGRIASLSQGIAERDAQIAAILSSRSWRVTRPLRWVVDQLSRVRTSVRFLSRALLFAPKRFDAEWYLTQNPDVTTSGMHPYKHYILHGQKEGRRLAPDESICRWRKNSKMPDAGLIATAPPIVRTHPVAVVLPVYRDAELTKACIESAMPGVLEVPGAILVIVNDASPEPGMFPMIDLLAARWPGRIEVLTNEHNLGFVATVNKRMKSYKHHDIVLLNSDVILPQGWLKRLIVEAYSRPRIATVTPLSNNTTICTFPEFLQENLLPFNLGVNEVDAAFRGSRLPNVEAPTGVGFCMYLRRECLDEVGYFNEERFGRGYGEENDFCQRAIKQGWFNLITPNLYVFHKGGVSFGSEKALLIETATQVIDELHPNYHTDVQAFICSDPLKEARLLRLSKLLASTPIPKVLHVSHGLGGGVAQHIAELADYLYGKNLAFSLVLMPQGKSEICHLRLGFKNTSDEIAINLSSDFEYLLQVLRSVGISLVHFHHIINVHPLLHQLPKQLHVQYRLTIHDFYLLNGNPTLTDKTGVFTKDRTDELFNPVYPLPKDVTPKIWRDSYRSFVEGAELVIFPSAETQRLFEEYFQIKHPIVAYHVEAVRDIGRPPKRFVPKNSYVIGVLGALNREKGADYLEDIARYASKAGIPLTFVLIGYAYRPLDKIKTTGPYQANEISGLIHKHECNILLFPARWPETYSYTLSYALESGLPIMAPALGAFPERLAGRENVKLFEHGISPAILLEQLCAFISALEVGMVHSSSPHSKKCTNPDFYKMDYLKNVPRLTTGLQDALNSIPQAKLNTPSLSRLTHSRGIREWILYGIWQMYTFPGVHKASTVIPYSFRRFVKRALSKRPMHEIVGEIMSDKSGEESQTNRSTALKQAQNTWDTIDIKQVRDVAWSSLAYFQERIWEAFGGEPFHTTHVLRLLKERLATVGRTRARGIALVCGDMEGERHFFEGMQVTFDRVDGYDLSEVSLRRYAPRSGLNYVAHAEDCNHVSLEPGSADLVVGWHGLHHVKNLSDLFSQARGALTAEGLLVMYEWIGPRYLQLPRRNRIVATALLLALFPSRKTRTTHMGKVKGLLWMQDGPTTFDPSEACNSEQLWPEFERHFNVLDAHFHAGLTYPMFEGIAQNLDPSDPTIKAKLRLVHLCERALTELGLIRPLFVVAVGEPRHVVANSASHPRRHPTFIERLVPAALRKWST